MADISQRPQLLSVSEGKRKLRSLAFAPSSTLSLEIPTDTVVKRMNIRFSGNVVTTFGSGTPVASAFSTVDDLVSNVRLVVDGSTTIKSTRPYMQQQIQLLTTGQLGERKSSAGAAAASFNNPTADGGFSYGTTTQVTTVAESFDLMFEIPFARKEDKYVALLNLKGRSTCELVFSTRAYSALLGFGNTAPVVFSADDFDFDVTLIEDRSIPKEMPFLDYIQSLQSYQYSSSGSDFRVKLPVSQYLLALSLLTRDGAAGSATTATGKLANSNVMGKVQIAVNGTNIIQQTTFQSLQAENRARWGINAAFASNVSRFDGWAFMDLLQDGKVASALDCRKSIGVDNVELVFDLQAVSYTNAVQIDVETHELRERT
jgi:hypothetical protein